MPSRSSYLAILDVKKCCNALPASRAPLATKSALMGFTTVTSRAVSFPSVHSGSKIYAGQVGFNFTISCFSSSQQYFSRLRANHSSSVPVISCMVWTETGCQRTCAAEGELKIKSNMNLFLASIILYQAFMAHALISGSCWGDRQSKLRKRRRARLGRASRMTFPGGIREIFNKVSAVNWFCQQVHGFSQSEASFKSPIWKATRLISIFTRLLEYNILCFLFVNYPFPG